MSEDIRFTVNGEAVSVAVGPTTPLLLVLRNDLGLRGTRQGCGEGECGACTVLVDDRPQTACNLHVEAVAGRAVRTIESLAQADPAPALLDAVLAEQAGQCGYCLAGILMRATALLAEQPRPSRADIVAALDENLCRCGAHNRIVRAIERAARGAEAQP